MISLCNYTAISKTLMMCALVLGGRLTTSAQTSVTTLTGGVVDTIGRPLAYASVGIVNKSVGTVTDERGQFQLYLTDVVQSIDSLRVSLLGYSSQTMLVASISRELSDQLKFTLSTRIMALAEVSVRTAKLQQKIAGNRNTKASMKTDFAISAKPRQNLGAEIGRVFPIPKKGAFLDEFMFFVSANNFDSTCLRINVYSLQRNYPADYLLKRPIYITLKPRQTGWITVDLRGHNLYVADDVAVGIEWVSYSRKGSYLGIPITIPSVGATHLYKFGSQNRWKKYGQMSACMSITLAYAP